MKCKIIFLILSLVCQLAMSILIKGQSDQIVFYKWTGNVEDFVFETELTMDFFKLPLENYPAIRLNGDPQKMYYAKSTTDNLLEIQFDSEYFKQKADQSIFNMPELKKRNKTFSVFDLYLNPDKNDFALSKESELYGDTFFENIDGSELSIYYWDIRSKIVVIHYSSIKKYKILGNDIKEIAPLLKILQQKELGLKIIVISNESISEYNTIKCYFNEYELYDIAILLNRKKGVNFEKRILELLGHKHHLSNLYLRISNDSDFNPLFKNNVEILSDKKVINRTNRTGNQSNFEVDKEEFVNLDKLVEKLILKVSKRRRRRLK